MRNYNVYNKRKYEYVITFYTSIHLHSSFDIKAYVIT